jgi:lysozyme
MKWLLVYKKEITIALIIIALIILVKKAKAMSTIQSSKPGEKRLPANWGPDASGIAHFKKWEGIRYKAYKDSAGLWTTGIGHLIKSNEQYLITKTLTEAEVMELFYKDIAAARSVVNKKIKVPITQGLYNALLSLAFNTGTIYNFIIQLVESGDMAALKKRWLTTAITVNNGKKVVQGLKNRRADEIKLF